MKTRVILSWVLLSACASVPVVPTPTLLEYQQACQNLAFLTCPIGNNPKCEATLQMEVEQHLTNVDVTCLTAATTKAAAVACGGVSCQ